MKPKKEEMMQANSVTNTPPLPLPVKEETRNMQAEVNMELFEAAHKEIKRRGVKIRGLMEWGLKAYLLETNPKEAARLGIVKKEKA